MILFSIQWFNIGTCWVYIRWLINKIYFVENSFIYLRLVVFQNGYLIVITFRYVKTEGEGLLKVSRYLSIHF